MLNKDSDTTKLSASFEKQVQVHDSVDQERGDGEHHDDDDNEKNLPPLPKGWIQQLDAYSKAPFYINVDKGETTWERPAPDDTSNNEVIRIAVVDDTGETASESADASGEAPLPEGWVEMKDAFSGVSYYVSDEETTWKRPVA